MAKKFKLGPLQRKWVNRLKRHPERQMKHQLGEQDRSDSHVYGACCLGEAGLVIGSCYFNHQRELRERKSDSLSQLSKSYMGNIQFQDFIIPMM